MSIAELERALQSKRRIKEQEAKERASYDYILADLIGRSVARIYSSSAKIPEIHEAYPSIFTSGEVEEKKAAKKAELSALRFKQFANAFNERFNGGGKEK